MSLSDFPYLQANLLTKKTHEQVVDATSLLELEEKTFLPFFANNAFTVFLVTLLLSIVAGAASIEEFWDGLYIKFGIIGILMVFYVHLVLHPFQSAPARRGELKRFLLWYWSAPESTWIRTSASANSTS